MTWFVLGCVTYEVVKLTASSYGIGTYGNPEEETRESLQKKRADRLAQGPMRPTARRTRTTGASGPSRTSPRPRSRSATRRCGTSSCPATWTTSRRINSREVLKYLRSRLEVPELEALKEDLAIDELITFDMFFVGYEWRAPEK